MPDVATFHNKTVSISDERLAEVALLLFASRERLAKYFESAVFAAPAWDMLLELFVGQVQGRRISTMKLCRAARVPPATGLRWIKRLTDQDLVRRVKVPEDDRIALVELTARGNQLMRRYIFEGLVCCDVPLPDQMDSGGE